MSHVCVGVPNFAPIDEGEGVGLAILPVLQRFGDAYNFQSLHRPVTVD